MNIAIVTDSTADLPAQIVERFHIHVVPNVLIIDGKNYLDGKDITRREFYERLPEMKTPPTTATASSGSYYELYHNLLEGGVDRILSIHASSLLSGIFNAASAAAQEFGERVRVVDSRSISMGIGFQVLAAADAAARNVSFEVLLDIVDDVQSRVHAIALLNTLEYIYRSGRVSWTRARVGDLLRIKPFVGVKNGRVESLGQSRTRRNGIERLHQILIKLGPLERLAILHSNAETDALRFLESLELNLTHHPLIVNVTTVIGTHVRPNGLGFAAVVR